MAAEGVPASGGYLPLPRVEAVRAAIRDRFGVGAADGPIPHADAAGEATVWLPQTLLLGDDALIDEGIAAFRKIAAAWG